MLSIIAPKPFEDVMFNYINKIRYQISETITTDNNANINPDQTLFIIDTSEDEESLKHFLISPNFIVLDAKKMHLDYIMRKEFVTFVLEEARQKIVHAMQTGRILVIRLGDSCTDFRNTFNDKSCSESKIGSGKTSGRHQLFDSKPPYKSVSYFPIEIFTNSGIDLLKEPWPESLYRRVDRDKTVKDAPLLIKDTFRVILTTTIPIEKHELSFYTDFGGLPSKDNFIVHHYP